MKIELKKISYNSRLSEETNAFTADIWINGAKVGTASNHGTGGPTDIYIQPHSLMLQAEAFCKNLPPLVFESPFPHDPQNPVRDTLDMDLELYIDTLLEKHLNEKHTAAQDKRWCKKQVCFRIKGDKTGEYRTIKKQNGIYTIALKTFITTKYGTQLEEILNEKLGEMPQ